MLQFSICESGEQHAYMIP